MEPRPDAFLSRLISTRRVRRIREHFDPDSGQVFSETECGMTSMIPSWVTATTGSLADLLDFRNTEGPGAPSLEETAVRTILLHLDQLDYQTLACLPWTVGRKIWTCVRHFRLDSFRTWRTFVRAYPEERDAFQDLHKVPLLSSRHYKFDEITKQIAAPNFEWITHLTLQDPQLSKADWTRIVNIHNLGALIVLGPESLGFDDRVVRAWGTAAKDNGAFSRLRVLFLVNQPFITTASFRNLHMLPALVLCNLSGCRVDSKHAQADGWKCISDTPVAHELNCEWTFSASVFDALLAYYRRAASQDLSPPDKKIKDQEPVLSLFRRSTTSTDLTSPKTLWFSRIDTGPQSDSKIDSQHSASGPPAKKRKVRSSKEKNLEDIMGSFGM